MKPSNDTFTVLCVCQWQNKTIWVVLACTFDLIYASVNSTCALWVFYKYLDAYY